MTTIFKSSTIVPFFNKAKEFILDNIFSSVSYSTLNKYIKGVQENFHEYLVTFESELFIPEVWSLYYSFPEQFNQTNIALPDCYLCSTSTFAKNTQIKEVSLPQASKIEASTFYYCTNLKSIELPYCKLIGSFAFQGAINLSTIDLPLAEYIYSKAFYGCGFTTSLTFPLVSQVDASGFYNCSINGMLSLPGLTGLGMSAFRSCSATGITLRTFKVPTVYKSTLSYTNTTFYVNSDVYSLFKANSYWSSRVVSIPNDGEGIYPYEYYSVSDLSAIPESKINAKIVYSYAFSTTATISNLTLPECTIIASAPQNLIEANLPKCTVVTYHAFSSMSQLTSVSLPECKLLDLYGFYNCTALTSISLPKCEVVRSGAFFGCAALSYVDIPNCRYIMESAFYNTPSTITIPSLEKCRYIGRNGLKVNDNIPGHLYECVALGSGVFPSVYNIDFSFPKLRQLSEYNFLDWKSSNFNAFNSDNFIYDNNVLLCKYNKTYITAAHEISLGAITTLSHTVIGLSAFCNNTQISEINGSCIQINQHACQSNSYITKLNLLNCKAISAYAFQDCSNLSEIHIENCINLGRDAFDRCSFSEIGFYNITQVPANAFGGCANLKSIYLDTSTKVVSLYTAEGATLPSNLDLYVRHNFMLDYKISTTWNSYATIYEIDPITSCQSLSVTQFRCNANETKCKIEINGYAERSNIYTHEFYSSDEFSNYDYSPSFPKNSSYDTSVTYSFDYSLPGKSITYQIIQDPIADWDTNPFDLSALTSGTAIYSEIDHCYSLYAYSVTQSAFSLPTSLDGIRIVGLSSSPNLKVSEFTADSILQLSNFSNSLITTLNAKNVSFLSSISLSNIQSITLGKVQNINMYTFRSCSQLSYISMAECWGVSNAAFSSCTALTSIVLNNCSKLEQRAFEYCTALSKVYLLGPSVIPIEDTNYGPFLGCTALTSIIVPLSLVSNYKTATYWYSYASIIYPAVEITECTSLSISADDCTGRATSTIIHVSAICNGYDPITGATITDVENNFDTISAEFPQNTSTTETVERELSYTYLGVTSSCTITQGVWENQYYTVESVGTYGFAIDSSITNPDPALYEGVYKSNNQSKNSTQAVAKITFTGYDTFNVYIRSYGEKNYDYDIASTLDAESYPTSYTSATAKASTRGTPKTTTDIASYTKVSYENDGGEHFIYIVYAKDSSSSTSPDTGWFLIEK